MTDSRHADKYDRVTAILSEYASGSDSLDTVAKRHSTTGKSVRQWAVEDAVIGEAYARARHISAGALEDAALDVANASTAESYQSDRIRIDTYKWAAAKRHPKEYGDKVQHDTTITVAQLHIDALRAPRITAQAQLTQQLTPATEQPDSEPLPLSE